MPSQRPEARTSPPSQPSTPLGLGCGSFHVTGCPPSSVLNFPTKERTIFMGASHSILLKSQLKLRAGGTPEVLKIKFMKTSEGLLLSVRLFPDSSPRF